MCVCVSLSPSLSHGCTPLTQWVGDIYRDPLLLVEQGRAEKKNLIPLYDKVSAAIRQVDDEHMIFYEPSPATLYPTGFSSGPGGSQYNDRTFPMMVSHRNTLRRRVVGKVPFHSQPSSPIG